MIRSMKVAVTLGALLGALAVCMALPSLDPGCPMNAGGPAHTACGLAPAWFSRGLALLEFVLGAGIALIVAVLIARSAIEHRRIARDLNREARPAFIADQLVGLVSGTGLVLVAGIRDPKIYCSADIVSRLEPEELRAVLLHERHHKNTHAPARLVLLSALAPVLGKHAQGRAWLERERAQIEIAADAHALANGASRPALARAIFKLQDGAPSLSLAAFASANTLRMQALLGQGNRRERLTRRRLVAMAVVAAMVSALLCSALGLV